jgi:hypothetical protein
MVILVTSEISGEMAGLVKVEAGRPPRQSGLMSNDVRGAAVHSEPATLELHIVSA